MMSKSFHPIFIVLYLVALSLLGASGLAELFLAAGRLTGSISLGTVLVNGLLAALLVASGWWRHPRLDEVRRSLPRARLVFWSVGPLALIAGGAALMALLSQALVPAAVSSPDISGLQIYSVTGAPLIEETVFRAGIGSFFRGMGGPWLGGYLSATFFSLMHTTPTLPRLLSGQAGFVLGPFLVGLACEYLFAKTGRFLPPFFFHLACNSTVLIFMVMDPRWLDWLSYLYL
jgi:membrane protease YdiL (CAAX protease family)